MRRIDRSSRHGAAASFSPAMQASSACQQELLQRNVWQSNTNAGKRRRPPSLYGNVDHDSMLLNERRHSLGTPQLDDDEFPVYSKFIYPFAVAKPVTHAYLRESDKIEIDAVAAVGMDILSHNGQHIYYAKDADPHVINTEKVVRNLTAFGRFLEILQRWPLPRLSMTTACICFLLAIFISPRTCAQSILFPAFRLSFGTLYPAYASYKAVRTKNVKEYVKWMMYWIVYAFFTCIETFTDIFLSWFPFYYEVKVIIVLWLLSPATKGSSTLYRKFVHPMLTRREQEIDEYLNQAKERGYSAVLQLGSKGVNYATSVIMQTALKGGGNLVQTIRRSYSLSDLSEPDVHRTQDEIDAVAIRPQQRMLRPRMQTAVGRSASGTRHSTGMYFTEVDVTGKGGDFNYNIRSSEDISSGYSSAEPGLSRTSSMTNASKARLKVKRPEMIDWEPQITPLERKDFATRYVPASALNDWKEDVSMDNDLYSRSTHSVNFETKKNISETPWCNNAIDMLERLNINMAQVSQDSILIDSLLESNDKNIETSLNLENIMMLQSDQLHVENNEKELESEEEEYFEDAISTVCAVDNVRSVNEYAEEEIYSSKSYGAINEEKPNVSRGEFPETRKGKEIIVDGMTNDEKPIVSPKELRDTLQEIENNFRATIEAAPTPSLLMLEKNEIELQNQQKNYNTPRRPIAHNKGKAPPPPPSLSRPPIQAHSSSSSSLNSSTDNTETSSISSIMKNIKANIFHSNRNNATTEPEKMKKSFLIETEI